MTDRDIVLRGVAMGQRAATGTADRSRIGERRQHAYVPIGVPVSLARPTCGASIRAAKPTDRRSRSEGGLALRSALTIGQFRASGPGPDAGRTGRLDRSSDRVGQLRG